MRRVPPFFCFVGLLLAAVVTPTAWRLAVDPQTVDGATPSYLPSVEATRVRQPFDDEPIWGLQDMQPGIVVIGDSMAGRVHPEHLDALMQMRVAPILMNASGSGYWYLAFKNYVVASGITPEWTLIFFRDTNLTDLTFRLLGDYRDQLDSAASDLEPALDEVIARRLSGPWHRAHGWIEGVYQSEAARAQLEPALSAWPARVMAGHRGGLRLQSEINDLFTLDRLRPMPLSDMSVVSANDADFHANVDTSVLPLLLSLARERGLKLCFVRTQRRAPGGGLRPESPALVQYMRDLREYIERGGGALIDDQHDQEIAQLPYDDLDHTARDARLPYTEILARKLKALSR